MENKRISWIDSVKGIGIILVVLGHRDSNIPYFLDKYIYSFHMPLFFFISGYLFNPMKYRDSREFICEKAKSLVIPYFAFSLISLAIYFTNYYIAGLVNTTWIMDVISSIFYLKGKVISNNVPLWFLICLFIVQIGYFLLDKISSNKVIVIFLIANSILGFIVGSVLKVRLPFGIDIAFVAITFYGIGNLVKDVKVYMSKLVGTIVTIICISINITLVYFNNVKVAMYSLIYGNYFSFYISAFAGILVCVVIAKVLKKSRILLYVGRNSLVIMATHVIIFWMLGIIERKIFKLSYESCISFPIALTYTIITIIVSIPIIEFINKYLPIIIGRNKLKKSSNTITQ